PPPAPRRAPEEPVPPTPPGVGDAPPAAAEPYDFRRPYGAPPAAPARRYQTPPSASPGGDFSPEPYDRRPLVDAPASRNGSTGITRAPLGEPAVESPRVPAREPVVPLGPSRGCGPIPSPAAGRPPAPAEGRRGGGFGTGRGDWRRGAGGGDALVRFAGCRDQADFRLFLSRHERQSARQHLRARLRQRARHRLLHARRRTQDHGEERL